MRTGFERTGLHRQGARHLTKYLERGILVTGESALAGNIDPNRAKPLQIGALLVVDMFTTMGNSSIFFVFFRIETF